MIVRNSSIKMGQLTQAVVVLCTLLSSFMGTNASPTPHSNIARRGIKFLGNSTRISIPVIKVSSESKREINGHVPATRFMPRGSTAAASSFTDEVSIPNTWFVTVDIGTPPQTFLFNPDSGAPDFMVLTSETGIDYTQPVYNPALSSTSAATADSSWSTEYGSGQILSGSLETDVVTVGDLEFEGFSFEIATSDNGVGGMTASGIFGLDHSTAGMSTTPQVQTWFGAVESYLEDPVFCVDFHKSTSTGTIDFGYIDSTKYTGPIGYAPLNGGGQFWTVQMTGVEAGSSGLVAMDFDIIVDTGTDGGNVPMAVAEVYFSNFAGSSYNSDWGTYQYPCTEQLIDFQFQAGGQLITIAAEYLGNGCIDSACSICISQLYTTTGTALWGRPFLEAMFVIFDWGNEQVGFAQKTSN